MKRRLGAIAAILSLVFFISGCTFIFQTGRRSDVQKIQELSAQLEELTRTQQLLENRLSQEIKDKQVSLKMMDKGLVITVVGDLLFDSGKAKIRPEAHGVLNKVGKVLKENVPNNLIGIEGHTDNIPIKFSGWKTNWELSTARALSVLHYLVENENISPERLSAIGYGEFHPVSDNDSKQGRQLNRRVEIVILPELVKVKSSTGTVEPASYLK
ncbi:MAG: flagellar motor protein MotB [Candidatus Omnitrophica bacterium]|nr:flagellar motor protein MotB [Candidatus Omnitrophota bacterium]MDD5512540.1 flagellar motor protein MotB [Candidatus Omnitrophota bacterium]